MNYCLLILLYFRPGAKEQTRRWVPLLNTQSLEKLGRKWGTKCLNTRFPLSTSAISRIQREADLFIFYFIFKGIGKGTALELWRCGANVVALSNQEDNLNKLKNEYPSIETVCVDLCDWNETRKIVDSLGAFDGLVNSAGFINNQPFLECSPETFDA